MYSEFSKLFQYIVPRCLAFTALARVFLIPWFSQFARIVIAVPVVNPRRACAARVTVVFVSVCLSVRSHLTSGASVRRENAASYSAGSEGQNIFSVFSETAPLPRSSAPFLGWPYI